MTLNEITNEIKQLSVRVKEISGELEVNRNITERIELLQELTDIMQRRFELDAMAQHILNEELRRGLLI